MSCLALCCCSGKEEPIGQDSFNQDYVVVTQHGIKNDGSEIGKELNDWSRPTMEEPCIFLREFTGYRNRSSFRTIILKTSILFWTTMQKSPLPSNWKLC